MIDSSLIKKVLLKDLKNLSRKIDRIISGNLLIAQGNWCAGCKADCPNNFNQPTKWSNNHTASFSGYEKFVMNVDRVVEKAISLLEEQFTMRKESP